MAKRLIWLACITVGSLACVIGAAIFDAAIYVVIHGWADILTNVIK